MTGSHKGFKGKYFFFSFGYFFFSKIFFYSKIFLICSDVFFLIGFSFCLIQMFFLCSSNIFYCRISASSATVYAYLGEMHANSKRAAAIAWGSVFISFSFITLPGKLVNMVILTGEYRVSPRLLISWVLQESTKSTNHAGHQHCKEKDTNPTTIRVSSVV